MTDLQVKMAEAMEKERHNRAEEGMKDRVNSAEYGLGYIPYDNRSNWNMFYKNKNGLVGDGFDTDADRNWATVGYAEDYFFKNLFGPLARMAK